MFARARLVKAHPVTEYFQTKTGEIRGYTSNDILQFSDLTSNMEKSALKNFMEDESSCVVVTEGGFFVVVVL